MIWVPSASKLDLSRGLATLLDPGIRKIAIANPQHAPYGVAAVAAMRHAAVYDKIKGKLVLGENISQAAQFVQSGNADAGILALSLALAPAMKNSGTIRRNPGRGLSAAGAGRGDSEIIAQQGTGEPVSEISQGAWNVALMEQYGFSVPKDAAAGHSESKMSAPH